MGLERPARERDQARRLGILVGAVMLALLFVVPFIGEEKNGARRWINVGMSLQPSEFLKPGFAIICAWILSWRLRDPGLPVIAFVTGFSAISSLFQTSWFSLLVGVFVAVMALGMLGLFDIVLPQPVPVGPPRCAGPAAPSAAKDGGSRGVVWRNPREELGTEG